MRKNKAFIPNLQGMNTCFQQIFKRTALFLICSILVCLCSKGQLVMNRDSLLKLLPAAKDDTAKVQLYLDIGNAYDLDDTKTAGEYYLMAGELSKRLRYNKGTIKFISNYTAVLNARGSFDSSLLLNKQSIQLANSLGDDIVLGKTWANTGNVFNYLAQYDSAAFYYETAKMFFERAGDNILRGRMSDLLQELYWQLGKYQKGITLGTEAVSLLKNTGDNLPLGRAFLNLGNNYASFGYADSAYKCYNTALAISKSTGYKVLELACMQGLADIYLKKFEPSRMRPYYEKALAISKEIGSYDGEAIARRGLALYFLLKNELGPAKEDISKALSITDSLGLKYDHVNNLKVLASILFASHDMREAEQCLDSASRMENRLSGDEMQKNTLAIEKKFETEKKETQIKLQQEQLRQRSILNYFLIAGSASLLLILLLSYRNYRNRKKLQQSRIDELETERQLTAAEAVLKGEEQERTRLARDLHDGLGGMLSGIKFSLRNMKENLIMTPDNAQAFERSIDMLDSSIKEMRRVAHNMMPEMLLRYGLNIAVEEFCNEINRSGAIHANYQFVGANDKTIDQTIAVTVYRIVQELVNNAIKHANAQNVLVQLQVSDQEKLLMITVEDDGKGFDKGLLAGSKGMGWSNIQNRVDFLKGKMDINSELGKGTSVLIQIYL
jgi:signal transduction histidine kinase